MRYSEVRENIYNSIIYNKMYKGYIQQVDMIKEEQCVYCKKMKKSNCRLKIENERCVNYVKMQRESKKR